MNKFNFYSPTYFEFGNETEYKAGELVKKFGGSRVLIVLGGKSAIRSGLVDRVEKSLDKHGLFYTRIAGVVPNPIASKVREGIKVARDNDIDFILAVGGGSVIDTAKSIAVGVYHDGDFWDFYRDKKIEKALPVGTVLTLSAAGSEASSAAVITNEDTMEKFAIDHDVLRPLFSILNPNLTLTLNKYQTMCGVVDMMCHSMERYFTNTKNVQFTDRMLEALIKSVIDEGLKLNEDLGNVSARENIMWAGMISHNDILGADRDQDWNTHKLEHILSAKYDCAHGAGLAVLIPAWMTYVSDKGDVMRMAQFANRVFGIEMDFAEPIRTAKKGIDAMREFIDTIGMPLTIEEVGAKYEDIDELVGMVNLKSTAKGFVALDREAVKSIYELASERSLKS